MRSTKVCACVCLLGALLGGCGEESDLFEDPGSGGTAGAGGESGADPRLDDPGSVHTWVVSASALAAYLNVYEPLAYIDGQLSFDDASCPAVTDDGSIMTITGGCRDSGVSVTGSVTIERTSARDLQVSFDRYGRSEDASQIPTLSGSAQVRDLSDDEREFDLDVVHEGDARTALVYSGTVTGSYDGATIWSGSGDVERSGAQTPTGSIHATTTAELVDDEICSGQPVSGETRLEGGGRVVVVTYDGATDCDSGNSARWELDGADQGALHGVTCSTQPLARRGSKDLGPLVFLALLAGTALLRRRTDERNTKRHSS